MAYTELKENTGLVASELFCLTPEGTKVEHDEHGHTVDSTQCWNKFTLQQCADFCSGINATHFQYGKSLRDENCACVAPGDHYTLTDNANWNLYGFGNATLASLGPPVGVTKGSSVKHLNSPDDDHLDTGVLLTIIVGGVLILMACLLAVFFFSRRWRRAPVVANEKRALTTVVDDASAATANPEPVPATEANGEGDASGENAIVDLAHVHKPPTELEPRDMEVGSPSAPPVEELGLVLEVERTAAPSHSQYLSGVATWQTTESVSGNEISNDDQSLFIANTSSKFDLSSHTIGSGDVQEIGTKFENSRRSRQIDTKLEKTLSGLKPFFPRIDLCCFPREFDGPTLDFSPPVATAMDDDDLKVV